MSKKKMSNQKNCLELKDTFLLLKDLILIDLINSYAKDGKYLPKYTFSYEDPQDTTLYWGTMEYVSYYDFIYEEKKKYEESHKKNLAIDSFLSLKENCQICEINPQLKKVLMGDLHPLLAAFITNQKGLFDGDNNVKVENGGALHQAIDSLWTVCIQVWSKLDRELSLSLTDLKKNMLEKDYAAAAQQLGLQYEYKFIKELIKHVNAEMLTFIKFHSKTYKELNTEEFLSFVENNFKESKVSGRFVMREPLQ